LLRRTVPKELYWLLLTVVLLGYSIYFDRPSVPIHKGLDISGGVRAILQAEPKPGQTVDPNTIIKVISNRVDAFGVAEPVIQYRGNNQFTVELPNVKNGQEIIDQLQATAQLDFRYFKDVQSTRNQFARYKYTEASDRPGQDTSLFTDTSTNRSFRDQFQILQDFQKNILDNAQKRPGATETSVTSPLSDVVHVNEALYLTADQVTQLNALQQELADYNQLISDSPQVMNGGDIQSNASAGIDGTTGPIVDLKTTADGVDKLGKFSREHVNESMAIILDGRVLEAPNVKEPMENGTCEISGGFATLKDAQNLANLLNAGALPMPLSVIYTYSVDGTLGPAAVNKSLLAGGIGLALVLAFMALYYLLPGLLADCALIIYTLFTLAVFKGALNWLGIPPVTLTLPGIAGFILSVGMAVDANILIFERLKEELRNGKSLKAAIDAGFSRAFPAIRDSNLCTLITSFILFTMGTAEVKGFALTLGIGVIISLFTAVTVTRTLLYLLVAAGAGKNLNLFGLKRQWEPKFNAVKNRKWFYGLSLLIIIPGMIAFFLGGLKQGIEFTGGTECAVNFDHSIQRKDIINAFNTSGNSGLKDSLIVLAKGKGDGTIAFITVKSKASGAYLQIERAIDAGFPDNQHDFESHQTVGPQISKELKWDALQAVLTASALIVLYLAFAFSIGGFVAGLRFGASAIVALFHDVLVLIGLFSIMGFVLNWQIDSLFVTAVLTVVGFSVHDTIVIFDRLRENLRHKKKAESFDDLANRSIQQSFARSINTSATVIMTLVALLVFGEPSTKLLDWALLIGIVSGTYSSIFNATPILVDWELWLTHRAAEQGTHYQIGTPEPLAAVAKSSGGSSAPTKVALDADSTPSSAPLNGSGPTHGKLKKRSGSSRRF
jgi:SecD/SecF fusion protein